VINKGLVYALLLFIVLTGVAGTLLWKQIERNGELDAQLSYQRDETRQANKNTEAANTASRLWKELWEKSGERLVAEQRRAASLEVQRQEALQRWAHLDGKLQDYFEAIQHDPANCDNQLVPPAVDMWMRELLSPNLSNGASGDQRAGGSSVSDPR
jgi:hypothetical protein